MSEQHFGEYFESIANQPGMPEFVQVSEEFALRKVSEADVEYTWLLYQDEAIVEGTLFGANVQSYADCKRLVAGWTSDWEKQQSFVYLLESQVDAGSVVGLVELFIDEEVPGRAVDFTVVIDSDFRGLGIASNAIEALEPVIVESLDIDRCTLSINRFNEASLSAAKKAGYIKVGKSGGMLRFGKMLSADK